jgi:hypothetical protein
MDEGIARGGPSCFGGDPAKAGGMVWLSLSPILAEADIISLRLASLRAWFVDGWIGAGLDVVLVGASVGPSLLPDASGIGLSTGPLGNFGCSDVTVSTLVVSIVPLVGFSIDARCGEEDTAMSPATNVELTLSLRPTGDMIDSAGSSIGMSFN